MQEVIENSRVAKAREQAREQDAKQNADKIIQGLEALDESHANRAIWELIQNACDVSTECEVIIDFSNQLFKFSHNGKPFTPKQLNSLIKQVSSKSTVDENEVGQFGTGFITTHCFGRKVIIDTVLEDEGFFKVKEFEIDRNAADSNELKVKLKEQEENVYKILRDEPLQQEPSQQTSFTYIAESDYEKENIAKAQSSLEEVIPYVLVFNNKLKKVRIIYDTGAQRQYIKNLPEDIEGVWHTKIQMDSDTNTSVFTLKSEDEQTVVALPLSSLQEATPPSDNLSRLFIHFPLIGTQNWGSNFIIHSKRFAPAERRDGIYVRSNNPSRKEKEESNTKVIEEATQLIFQYLDRYSPEICNPIYFAPVHFEIGDDESPADKYYQTLKAQWVSKMVSLPLVETNCDSGRICPNQAVFLSSELITEDDETFDALYKLACEFYKDRLPVKSVCKEWTSTVCNWDDKVDFISFEGLCDRIASIGNLDAFDKAGLQAFYSYIKEQKRIELFSSYKLLPNTKGNFHNKEQLKNATRLPGELLDISYGLIEEESRSFIHPDFVLGFDFESFDKKSYYEKLKLLNSKYNDVGEIFPENIRNSYIRFCSIYANDQVEGTRRRLMPLICDFYDIEHREQFMPNPDDDKIEFDEVPLRGLIKNVLLDISKRPDEDSEFLNNYKDQLLFILITVFEQKALRDSVANLKVYPNQLGDFCILDELEVECPTFKGYADSEDIKDLYEEVVGTNIRSKLLHDDFVTLLNSEDRIYKGSTIGGEIEAELSDEKIEADSSKKKYKKNIISLLSGNKELENIFPVINSKKAEFMLSEITEGGIKDDVFSFLNLRHDQIKGLGKLIAKGGIDTLINKAETEILIKERQDYTLRMSQKIGLHIEKLIKESLEVDLQVDYVCPERLADVEVDGVQNGQDIIIKIDAKNFYFIEVKTRWSTNDSVRMSKNQLRQAYDEKDRYALCAINLGGNDKTIEEKLKIESLNEIMGKIRVLTNIGERVSSILEKAYEIKDSNKEFSVEISRGTVPQKLIDEGYSLPDFIDKLKEGLEKS
ncbi:sacsin N-terminal ATP-binding-like domain-containing protein [Roseivirga sp. BDSF3-8]|uniref:sacsin N-terminal ATP-binding-like domain-containing protein n=1 Tax=Roseivirga sp. BDSF3-8 TaxID=3241598 RepID=UPI0035321F55